MNCLNLGCGTRYRYDWVNLDINEIKPYVRSYDLRRGIPYPDRYFDLVYHSHLLEHFSIIEASVFLKECQRVLKVCGVIRVVVPDLEEIARLYLKALEGSLQGEINCQHRYEWMMLELYDQVVREKPGGNMLDYLIQPSCPDEDFIRQRLGGEADKMLRQASPSESRNIIHRWKHPSNWLARAGNLVRPLRDKMLTLVLGDRDMRALILGRFRLCGEVHQWMYDRHSLAQALITAGFHNPIQQAPTTSLIPGWSNINLDIEPDGTVYKPDSLYMEAVKPT